MAPPAKRTFKHVKPGSIIDHYEWTRRGGLMVIYSDGLKCKSHYTLPELLRTKTVVEIKHPPGVF